MRLGELSLGSLAGSRSLVLDRHKTDQACYQNAHSRKDDDTDPLALCHGSRPYRIQIEEFRRFTAAGLLNKLRTN
jgi:hypothetical protein